MKGCVLRAREEIHDGTRTTRASTVEVADRSWIIVDAADAAQRRGHIAHLWLRGIEALLPAAKAAAEMEVPEFFGDGDEVALHARTCAAGRRTTTTGIAPTVPRKCGVATWPD